MSHTGQSNDEVTLVLGLDIGTTFSGLAFQLHKGGRAIDQIREVRAWPCPPGYAKEADQVKVPTKLDYSQRYTLQARDGNDDEDEDRPLWGYLVIGNNKTTIEWPKLLLINEAELPSHFGKSANLKKSKERMEALKKSPTKVIIDYIRQLWTHAFGDDQTQGYIDRYLLHPLRASGLKKHIVVTIPAIWKNSAVEAMRNALGLSILGEENVTYEFKSEPEAGMMALASHIRCQMDSGDVAVCLALGGGTADCISYMLTSKDEMTWEEVVPGNGGLCGAMCLDEAFYTLLHRALRVSEQPTSKGWRMLLRTEWEHSLKRDFEFAPMATPAENTREIRPSNITDQSVMLHARQIRAIFDSVTNRIIELVEHQVNEVQKATGKPPRTILVVGGFGRCRPFIRGALKFEFDGRSSSSSTTERGHKRARTTAKNDIHILSDTGDMPWAAICRGAVLAKLEDNARLESRKARFSLGFPQSIVASTDDNKREGQWDSLFGCHMVPNVMTRILKRGDSIRTSDKILHQMLAFSTTQAAEEPDQAQHEATFFVHPGEKPPTRWSKRNKDFQEWGTMVIKVPCSLYQLPLHEGALGGRSYVFDYDLHINSCGESMNVVAYTAKTGQKVGELALDVA